MTSYTLAEIATIVKGKLINPLVSESDIRFLSFDSRTILSGKETLFFALKNERNNGHHYIADAYDKEVVSFIVEKLPNEGRLLLNCSFIIVENTLEALQSLAAFHRHRFHYPVTAITGSNGKTIVKEWLAELLADDFNIVRSPRSYNSQIGNPLSVWLMDDQANLALFEAGISKPGEMEKLERILSPDHGIFTHLGSAHLENFTSVEELVQEKLKLFTNCKLIVYCGDFRILHKAILNVEFPQRPKIFRWSEKDQSAELFIVSKKITGDSTTVEAIFHNERIKITVPFTDNAYVENAVHCWSYLLAAGYPPENFEDRFLKLTAVAMRLEIKKGINGCAIIDDTYNSDTASLVNALDFLKQQCDSVKQRSTIIISDILQSGKNPESLYLEVADFIRMRKIDRIIGIGEEIIRHNDLFSAKEKQFYPTTEEYFLHFREMDYRNEVILLKGARAFRFDRISSLLQEKAHQTVMEIDLTAMIHNLNFYRQRLKPETKVMAMVKAFSYGTGSVEVARILQFRRVDYLAVAIADEGIELRNNGMELPIIVMNPEEHSFDSMIENRLEPNIYRYALLVKFDEALRRNAVSNFPVHLKIDTGMKRLGFDRPEQIKEVAAFILERNTMYIKSVFSHLAVSDDPGNDAFTRKQFSEFDFLSSLITKSFDHKIMRHILNSSGIERFPEMELDMVRLGIGLYGVSPKVQSELKNVATLKTTISQIRDVEPGETVGYGRRGIIDRPSRIAILPIGYADGYSRKLGNGVGKVVINGKIVPIVGTICMDMCMVDVTDIDAKEGDRVVIFGEEQPVSQIAEWLGTIAYEVLTTVGQRVKRVYFAE